MSDTVGLLELNDGQSNAFGHQMLKETYDCLVAAEEDLVACAGALVIAGSPKIFSSGFDLGTFAEGPESAKRLINEGAALCERLVLFPRPVVAAATGHAVALGAFVLLTGDWRVGAETVKGGKPLKVGLNETANNMYMPDFFAEGARAVLAPQFFREAVSLGLIFDAEHARIVGFLNEVVPHENVLEVAQAKAKELAAWCKHPAFRHNKRLVQAPYAKRVMQGRWEKPGEPLRWLHPAPPSKL